MLSSVVTVNAQVPKMLQLTNAKTSDLSTAHLPAVILGLCATLGATNEMALGAPRQEPLTPPPAVNPLNQPDLPPRPNIESVDQAKQKSRPQSDTPSLESPEPHKEQPSAEAGEPQTPAEQPREEASTTHASSAEKPAEPNGSQRSEPTGTADTEQARQEATPADSLWHAAQISVLCASLVGLPFLWLTWRKRADEAFDRRKTNDEIKNGRLESDIRMNIHRFDVDASGQWKMEILNTGRITVRELFSEQNVYADVLGKAASLCNASQPFPLFNIDKSLAELQAKNYAFFKRSALPSGRLMSYNLRVRLRDLMSAEYNPERRTLDTEKKFERRRIFGILVREKSPVASTLVLCVLPEKSFRLFGDENWVENLRKNCDEHGRARIDQLKSAYEHEKGFLAGEPGKSVFPWANVYFPVQKKKHTNPPQDKSGPLGNEDDLLE